MPVEYTFQHASPAQSAALLSIADAFLPALTATETQTVRQTLATTAPGADPNKVQRFLQLSAADDPDFVRYLDYALGRLPQKALKDLGGFLDLIHGGGLLAVLFLRTTTGFAALSRDDRVKVLQNWRDSRFQLLRGVFCSLRRIVLLAYMKVVRPALEAIGYADHGALAADPDTGGEVYAFTFEDSAAEIEADIVIVGSGAGGGVAAATLGEKLHGKKIVVVEAGDYVPQSEMPIRQEDAERMFDGGLSSFMSADDSGILLAGKTWGGSTAINYAASVELAEEVRREWAEQFGLAFATSQEFQDCFDRVLERIGATTEGVEHNGPNAVLQEGARKLGLPCLTVPQNTAGKQHNCGLCTFGCRSGVKMGTNNSFLPDAHRAGVICIRSTRVDRILSRNNTVTGISATRKNGSSLTITAARVIVAAGALRTPCLLLHSGVQNPHLGHNLKVHPMAMVVGYRTDKPTDPWEGSTLTTLITAHHNPATGSACRIFTQNMWPASNALFLPWSDPVSFKARYLASRQSVWAICMARDRFGRGEIAPDENGDPVMRYELDPRDQEVRVEGMVQAARVLLAGGCAEVLPLVDFGDRPFPAYKSPSGAEGEGFGEWERRLRVVTKGVKSWTSAHPQGTVRMGRSAEEGVVDERGRVHGWSGLYVADASVFASAVGTNPMVAVMAVGEWVARGVVREIEEEGDRVAAGTGNEGVDDAVKRSV